MTDNYSLTYVEMDIPAFTQNSPPDSPLLINTLRFALDTDYLPQTIDITSPNVLTVTYTTATISLGQNLGQRASVTVTFKDHQHIWAGEDYSSGTFWGKFRARYGLKLRGRLLRVIRGLLGQVLSQMETRTYVIEETNGPDPNGRYKVTAKDLLKLADDNRSQAPRLSNGFLLANLAAGALSTTLSPSGIGDQEYPATGTVAIGGKEVCFFYRDPFTKLIINANGNDASTTFTDTSPIGRSITANGSAQVDTAQSKFGGASALLGASGNNLSMADSADWVVGNAQFTIRLFLRFTTVPSGTPNGTFDNFVFSQDDGAGNRWALAFDGTDIVFVSTVASVNNALYTATHGLSNNTWHHIEIARSGTFFFVFKDGVSLTLTPVTPISTNIIPDVAATFIIGGRSGVPGPDWVDDFVFRKGVIDHISNFTPPTTEAIVVGSGDVITLIRGQANTADQAHNAQDRVQVCLNYNGLDPAAILYDLFTNYADIDPTYIPVSDWLAETSAYLGVVYTAIVAEPTGVAKLASELIEQMAGAIWWDDIGQKLRLQILRAVPSTATVYDETIYQKDSLDISEQPTQRVSEVQVYFGKISPLEKEDQLNNYRCTARVADDAAAIDYGSSVIKQILSRWISSGGRSTATILGNKILGRYRDPPRRFKFQVMRYIGWDPSLGAGYQLGGTMLQTMTGAAALVPIQAVRITPNAEFFEVEAEEMLWTPFGGDVDPTIRTITLDFSENNINIRTRHDQLYPAPQSGDTVNVIVNSGVIIGSTSTALAAIDVGTWPGGVTLTLTNSGRIQGCGGAGGFGANTGPQAGLTTGGAGFVGGPALFTRQAITVTGTGQYWSGGGGGGGGGLFFIANGNGGGGGAGTLPGTGGPGGAAGNPGTSEAGGAGGFSGGIFGGTGGGPGLPGSAGLTVLGAGGAGGAAGLSVDGKSFVNGGAGVTAGDVRGSQAN